MKRLLLVLPVLLVLAACGSNGGSSSAGSADSYVCIDLTDDTNGTVANNPAIDALAAMATPALDKLFTRWQTDYDANPTSDAVATDAENLRSWCSQNGYDS